MHLLQESICIIAIIDQNNTIIFSIDTVFRKGIYHIFNKL
jgi:hypothetical protein